MAAVFDPNQPFQADEGETLDTLTAPRPRVAPPVAITPPVGPVFDPAQPFTPVADAPAGAPVFNPSAPVIKVYGVEEFAAKSVDELLADKDFMPVQFGVQHENDLVDPALRSKLEEVYAARERAGTSLKDKVKSTFTGIFPAVKTLTEGVKSAAKLAAKFTPAGIAKRVIEGTPQEVINDYAKSGTEAAASVELAALGSTDLIRRSTRAVGEAVGMLPGDLPAVAAASGVPVRRSKADMTEGDWRNRLSDDIAAAKQVEVAGAGNGEVMQALGIDAATLEQDFGIKVDPEEIAKLSVVTDPINYVPLGAAVGAVTKLGGKLVRVGVAATRTSEQAAKLANILNTATAAAGAVKSGASTVVGAVAQGVGGVVEKIGAVADKGVRSLGGTGAGVGLGGILGGNVYSALGGAAIAKAAPRLIQKAGKTITATGKILTGEAAAPAALTLAGDTLKAGAAGAVKGAVEGGALILPFEIGARPEEEEQLLGMVGLGAGLRGGAEGVRPGARAAGRAAQNKLAETIFQTVEQQPLAESPTYGTDSLLDSNHAANVAKISPREQKLVAWGRELLRQAGGEVYVLDTPTFAREAQGNKTARGYAVSIGETVAPDGSAKPLFRILLNRDAEALPHEFFHALTDLDPKRAADFRDTVKKSLTPDQLRSFEQLYNSLRNDGLPEVQWKTRLTPEQVANEAAAETFSRIFLAQDLSGVAPSVQNKAALFVSSLLEKLGAPLAKVGANPKEAGVSSLGVRPGTESVKVGQAWVKNMLQRVNDEGTLGQPPILPERPATPTPIPANVVRRKPVGAKPVPAAPVPVPAPRPEPVNPPLPAVPTAGKRNIRTTRANQNDFAGQRAEVTGIDEATAAAEATGDAAIIARTAELSQILETGNPVLEIEHSGAKAAGTAEAPSGRTARWAEIESGSDREAHQKTFIITRLAEVGKKPFVFAMSLDKVLQNRDSIARMAAEKGAEGLLPYPVEDGRFSDATRRQITRDISAYVENQANGYRGDGGQLVRPAEDIGISIPAENPNYTPRPLTEAQANFVNALMGTEPFLPRTAREVKGKRAGNEKGQILAEVNARQPEAPATIRPQDITKQTFTSGRSIAEMNPLRNELSAAGVPVRELMDVNERIRIADISSVTPRPELDFKAPVTDTIRGGFLPGDTASAISEVQAMSGDEFTAQSNSRKGRLTQWAWETGLNVKSPEEVLALKAATESAREKGRALMAEKKYDEASPWIYKGQFFREAYEAATDTASAAGPGGWRSAFPDREAPFPEAKAPAGAYMPGDAVKRAEKAVEENGLFDQGGKPLKVNPDGTVTLYHRTSEEAAKKVRETGKFTSLENTDETFFSNVLQGGQAEAFGDSVLTVKVNPKWVRINDAMPDEIHVTVSNRHLGKSNLLPEGAFMPAEPFYSELQRVIDEKVKGDSIPATQLAALVRNAGVKPEELKWSGLDDYLAGKSKVSVPELKKFLRENAVQLEEVEKGGGNMASHDGEWSDLTYAFEDEYDYVAEISRTSDNDSQTLVTLFKKGDEIYLADETGNRLTGEGYFTDLETAKTRGMEIANSIQGSEGEGLTKFENYQVPGGENYRELLLTLPNRPVTGAKLEVSKPEPFAGTGEAMWGGRHPVSGVTESSFTFGNETGRITFWPDTLSNSRHDGPKYVVNSPNLQNARFDTLGQAKTAIENSAYIQKANDKGKTFQSSHFDEPNVLAHVRFNERTDSEGGRVLFLEEVQSDWHQKGKREGYAAEVGAEARRKEAAAKAEALLGKRSIADLSTEEKIEWNRLQGEASVSVSPNRGVPDAPFKKTWPLLAVKRMIRYAAENGFDKLAWTPGDIQAARYDLSKHISELRVSKLKDGQVGLDALGPAPDYRLVISQAVAPDKVADFVGKDLAEKIAAQKESYHEYSDLDLKVGGEGMRGFYDQILPKEVGAYVKKWGAKVEKASLVEGEVTSGGKSATPKIHKKFDAWSVTLTPSMRTDVLTKGQKMFLPRGGAIGQEITPASVQRRGPATPLPPLTANDLENRRGR